MANQTIDIKLVVSEEVSKQLAPLAAEIKSFHSAISSGADRSGAAMQKFGGAVRLVHREFSTLTRLTLGGLVGGGVVAGIVAASKALGDMGRQAQQLHYQAQALGTTPAFLEQMSDGLLALGVDAETAKRDVQGVMSTLRDAETYGTKSQLFQALEKGVYGSGKQLWREIQQQMAGPEGAEGAFKFLISRIDQMKPSGQRAMLKALNLSSLAFRDLKEVLPQLHKRIQLSREETQRLAVANANFEISAGNIGRILGSAVMPGLEKVTTAFAKFLQTENGKKFAEQLRTWSDSLGTAIADWIKDEGPDGLNANIQALKKEVGELKTIFLAADKVIKGIGGWKWILVGLVASAFIPWLWGVHRVLGALLAYPGVTLLLTALAGAAWMLNKDFGAEVTDPETRKRMAPGGDLEKAPTTYYEFFKQFMQDVLKGNIDLLGHGATPQPQSGTGLPKSDQERRADIEGENRERMALLNEIKDATASVAHVNDWFGIGGPEGSNDGGSGFQFDTSSILGPAGGGKSNRPWPTLPAHATPLSRIPGTDRPAQTSGQGFASFYGNRPDLGFVDTGDKGRKGVSERDQGIALGSAATLGDYHYLTDPHTGLTHVAQQTDTGPNIRTQALTDIHASQLNRMGYTKDTFPNKRGIWDVQPAFPSFKKESSGLDYRSNYGSSLAGALASESGGRGGSATVDIDVGGLGQSERDPSELFKPQPLDGAIQMQNATHQANNSLSFQ